jgi:hypothetical protein
MCLCCRFVSSTGSRNFHNLILWEERHTLLPKQFNDLCVALRRSPCIIIIIIIIVGVVVIVAVNNSVLIAEVI